MLWALLRVFVFMLDLRAHVCLVLILNVIVMGSGKVGLPANTIFGPNSTNFGHNW